MQSQDFDESTQSGAGQPHDSAAGQVGVPGPGSPSAARLLELTARETDQWRADAKEEAAAIVAAAHEEADELVRAAQRESERLLEDARLEAARTLDEARTTAEDERARTEAQRTQSAAEVERLQQVAAEHSDHLRQHLNDVLGRLDGLGSASGPHA